MARILVWLSFSLAVVLMAHNFVNGAPASVMKRGFTSDWKEHYNERERKHIIDRNRHTSCCFEDVSWIDSSIVATSKSVRDKVTGVAKKKKKENDQAALDMARMRTDKSNLGSQASRS